MRLRMQPTYSFVLVTLIFLAPLTTAHTWVERTMRIAANGTMVGTPGYERAHAVRGSPGYIEDNITGKTPTRDENIILDTDPITPRPEQRQSNYTTEFPMLSVSEGDWVALQYLENGHVSLPQGQPGKPLNRGTVYVYGTTMNDLSNVKWMDVHLKWNKDGTGGDGQGKLIATRNYDDGQCYEFNDGEISKARQSKFKKSDDLLMGKNLWCQTDVQIPTNLTVGSTYTMIWLWDWPYMDVDNVTVSPAVIKTNQTVPTTSPYVKTAEAYSSIVDFKIVDPCDASLGAVKGPLCSTSTASSKMAFKAPIDDWTNAAVGEQLANLFQVSVDDSASGFTNPSESTADMAGATGYTTTISASNTPSGGNAENAAAATISASVVAPSSASASLRTTTRSSSSSSVVTSSASSATSNNGVPIITITVPATIVTVTVTAEVTAQETGTKSTVVLSEASATPPAAGAATASQNPGPPSVTGFLTSRSSSRRIRRGSGEWGLGQH